jgi:predicted RNA-binding Zn-ribbon protein involved in translation (DUF1610 family)
VADVEQAAKSANRVICLEKPIDLGRSRNLFTEEEPIVGKLTCPKCGNNTFERAKLPNLNLVRCNACHTLLGVSNDFLRK